MSVGPSYGETLVSDEDLEAMQPVARAALGPSPSKAEVFDIEQAVQTEVSAVLLTQVLEGDLSLADLLRDTFLRELHSSLYESVWTWAGVTRIREVNIGVAPEQIVVQLRESMDTLLYRWQHTVDWSPREFGMAVHADTVRIHPFKDGNGRTTWLLADLVFLAAQDGDQWESYDWDVDKAQYIDVLREYDRDRDPRPLAAFVPTRVLGS